MNGSDLNYNFGRKNQWRKWVWNKFKDSFPHNRKEKIILYLSGPSDIDREIAINKGFDSRNLIAVDTNHKNIENIRKSGNLAICGDLSEIIFNWNMEPISGIHADFCHGVNDSVINRFMLSLCSENVAPGAAICANFLRGRDTIGARMSADNIKHLKFLYSHPNHGLTSKQLESELKKRSWIFFNKVARLWTNWLIAVAMNPEQKRIQYKNYLPEFIPFWITGAVHEMKASFSSYRSKNSFAFMDTVFFRKCIESKSDADGDIMNHLNNYDLKRQLSAIKAIRTRRIKSGDISQLKSA